jgi:hypothetical protein
MNPVRALTTATQILFQPLQHHWKPVEQTITMEADGQEQAVNSIVDKLQRVAIDGVLSALISHTADPANGSYRSTYHFSRPGSQLFA